MRKIDAHSHIGWFGSWCDVGVTAEEAVLAMERYDIEKSIISYPDNAVTLAALRKFPHLFTALAWLDPHKGEKAMAELDELTGNHAFAGIKLHPLFNAYAADDPAVFPLMERAQELDLPVFIHSGHAPFSLPWSIGRLARLYPKTRIVMIHMGHGHGVYIQAALETAAEHDNIYLENSGMPMHTKIREAYARIGAERIFWGSDAPFHHYAVEILRTQICGLTETQLEDVFYNNSKKFMGW